MRQILYPIQFKGNAAPANESGTILKAIHRPSCCITSVTRLLFATAFCVVVDLIAAGGTSA